MKQESLCINVLQLYNVFLRKRKRKCTDKTNKILNDLSKMRKTKINELTCIRSFNLEILLLIFIA